MRKAEQRLWDTMRRHAASHYVHLERIENVVGEGTPDVVAFSPTGLVTWIELKAPHRPARPTTRLLGSEGLRQSQINWLLKASSYNVHTFVLIRDDTGALLLVSGRHAAKLNGWTFLEAQFYSRAQSWNDIMGAIS